MVTLSITKIDSVKCYQGADGALTTSTTGGSNGYKYTWNDPSKQTSSKASSLKKGTYKVIVKDLYGCSDSATGTVNEPAKVTLSITKIDSVKCYQGADGALTTSTTGGSNGYKYTWNDPSKQTSSKASSLKKGTYKVIVKDLYGCSDSATGTVNEPAKIAIAITIDSVNCYQGSDGSITTSISGGSNGYKYIWDDASKQTTSKAINLKKGTYKLIVKDIYGCTDSIKAKVNEPAKVTISLVSADDITCYGKGDGQISVSAAGGTPAIKFSWSHSTALNTSTVKIKNKGLYCVKVVDYYGCTDSMNITINEPDPLLLFVDSVTRPKCYGSADGQITVNSKGGNNGFVYTWLTTPNRYGKSLTAIKSGKYIVKVVDSKGCFDDLSIEITNPDSLNSKLIVDSVLCQGTKTGRLLVIPKGGTPGYSYSWANNSVNGTSLNENLGIGNYVVYVIDKNNCKQKLQGEIKEPSKLTLAKNVKMVSCFGDSDGEILVQAIGGTLPYKYSWGSNPILNNNNIKNLEFGIYNVYVKDRNNCILHDTIQISQPKNLDVAVITKEPTCYQFKDGSISLLVSGGTPAYIYKWDKYATINSATLVNLSAGKYVVDVLDIKGCTTKREIEIREKDSIKIRSIISAPKCNGSTDASVSILKINSQGSISVKWTSLGGKINNSLNNLGAGKYPVEITDSVGCKSKSNVQIQNPEILNLYIDQKNESCKARLDGQIAIKATGGIGSYKFYLDTQMSRYGVFYNLKEGGYKAMVKDSNGCSTFRTVNITAPDSLKIVKLFQRDNLCFGQNSGAIGVQGMGGSVPYNYYWNHGSTTDTINGLVAGHYSLTITDKNGCQSNNLFTIKQPEKLKLVIQNIINPYCLQNQSGSFDLRVSGGVPPIQYWKNGKNIKLSEFEKLDAGKVVYQASDANNCIVTDSINLKYQRSLSANIPGPLIFEKNRFRMIIPTFSGIDTQLAKYLWTKSSDFKEQTFVRNPIVRFTENKWIKLTVIDDKNCLAEDSTELLVFDRFEKSLPNSFTPNGDGVNDVLEFPKFLTIKELIIFDRFGKVLFESFSDDPIWNGDCENRSVPQGNYTYIVSFQLPGSKEIIKVKGLLTILR
jgi:gliding motility-associated-like protein